ncbi:MAG: hypothetical protein U9O89_07540 [Thermoproteota archaeon]|nr:hypothetical protein [Thermoproteota archaeon]
MAETYKWLFVGDIPILCEKKKVARQFSVEMWLDPTPLFKALKLRQLSQVKVKKTKYIV